MGKISERIAHTKIVNGYCLICGEYGKLSIDHVPPQGAITITKVEQRHISEMLRNKPKPIKGVTSTNGSKFRTICNKCNSEILGANDSEIAKVNKDLINKISNYFINPQNIYSIVSTEIDAVKFARAMVGHVLSATSVEECKKPLVVTPYFGPLQEFVLGNDEALDDNHDIYYWFYPRERHISAKYVLFCNEGHSSGMSLLSFFPIAFLITPKNEGIYPIHAKKFDLKMNRLVLDLASYNVEYADFPFVRLKGNSMFLLTDYQAIISYPIKG